LKRILALVLALLLLYGSALAGQERPVSIATYTLPAGAEALHLMNAGVWAAPEGLEKMYEIMQNADPAGNIYLTRMKNGRALVSVSCSEPRTIPSMQELQQRWYDSIAKNLADEDGVYVYSAEGSAKVTERYGFEALQINTTLEVPFTSVVIEAEGVAFRRGEELLEVWAVAPEAELYAQDETAAKELASDRADMEAFLQSLDFSGLETASFSGTAYRDPDGRFALMVPENCTVITQRSTQAEIDEARAAYTAVHPEGGEGLFDEYMRDVNEQNVVVFIDESQQAVVEIFASREEDFMGVTADQLLLLAQPIQQSLMDRFDIALLLSDSEQTMLSGHRHACLTYWLRNGNANVQLDVLAAVLDDAWLYEVDIYTHDGDQELRALWYTFINSSMIYTPLVNGLE